MRFVTIEPLLSASPDESRDRLVWNYLAELGLVFALVVAAAAISLLTYAFVAFCILAN